MSDGPRIGLALGSGSARGLSHIGVLEVFQAEGIPIHGIAGTSIGAVIGGLWATGSVDDYKQILGGLNLWRVMGFFEPALSKAGIFSGGRLVDTLKKLTGEPRIERLPVRYVAVATDAESGQEIRLFRGDLVQAIRASFAIPGLFSPVHWEGRWLVDGGVKAPVPIEAAKALGADVVIAVNLNTREAMHASAKRDVAPNAGSSPVAIGIDETVAVGVPAFRAAMGVDPLATTEISVGDMQKIIAEQGAQGDVADESGAGGDDSEDGGVGWVARLIRRNEGDEPPGLAYTLTRSLDWMQVELADLQIRHSRPEILIEPRCGTVKLFDYDRSDEIIEAGRIAARAALPQIRALL
jgi:NTE family protein